MSTVASSNTPETPQANSPATSAEHVKSSASRRSRSSASSMKISSEFYGCDGTKSHAEDFPVWFCMAKGAAHSLRIAYSALHTWSRDKPELRDGEIDKESIELVKSITVKCSEMMVLKGRLVYKNVLKLLPHDAIGVGTARAQLRKAFQELATSRRKLVAGLDAILCGIDSFRSGVEKAVDCVKIMCVSQKELNKMELFVLAMAVRDPVMGPKQMCGLWADHFQSLSTEHHAMMLAWVSTRKEAMEWAKALSPSCPLSPIICWVRHMRLYGKFRRDYELPLLKLRMKSLMRFANQGNKSEMGSCFCLGGASNVNEEGCRGDETGKHASATSTYLTSRLPHVLQSSFSVPRLSGIISSQNDIKRSFKDAQAKHFSDSYGDLAKMIGRSQTTCASSPTSSSCSTASGESARDSSSYKYKETLAAANETAGAAGSLDKRDEMPAHCRNMMVQIGGLSRELSEARLARIEDIRAYPTAV